VADAAHSLAQLLADLAAEAGDEPRRVVPRLSDLAVGDQVAVTLHDLVAALGEPDDGGAPAAAASSVAAALHAVEQVRDQCERSAPGLPGGPS